jgi:hypothetical protein
LANASPDDTHDATRITFAIRRESLGDVCGPA